MTTVDIGKWGKKTTTLTICLTQLMVPVPYILALAVANKIYSFLTLNGCCKKVQNIFVK